MLSTSAAGAAVAASTASVGMAAGILGGALVGAVAGIGAMLAVDKWEALYEWILLYDSAGAAGSRG